MLKNLANITSLLALFVCSRALGQDNNPAIFPGTDIPLVRITYERLPDLNIPRSSASLAIINGEPTIFGGSTTGFVLTRTAEWFDGKRWHEIPMLYNHGSGAVVPLSSGDVMIAGGSEDDFGIGQTWGAELYHPESHSFSPLPNLARKRAVSSGAELPGGTVVISGNWYDDDDIETFTLESGFSRKKAVAEERSRPFILPVAPDNAMIFSRKDQYAKPSGNQIDMLEGEPFVPDLFGRFTPLCAERGMFDYRDYLIGDPSAGDYSYIIPVSGNEDGLIYFALVRGQDFSLLETRSQMPASIGRENIDIDKIGIFFIDKKRERAYLVIFLENDNRFYFVELNYGPALSGGKASITFLQSDPMEEMLVGTFALTPQGNIILAGGGPNDLSHNFLPTDRVYIFNVVPEAASSKGHAGIWPFIAGGFLLLSVLGLLLIFSQKKSRRTERKTIEAESDPEVFKSFEDKIVALMEEEQIFRRKGLKILDIAQILGTNVSYVSSCINNMSGGSFNDYVNKYRIRFAQQYLLDHPDKKVSQAIDLSGFSSEASFFRNFRALTGQTPGEWLEKARGNGNSDRAGEGA